MTMIEPRLTTAPVSLLMELRLVSGSTLATFELRLGETMCVDALDSEEHDGLGALASECRTCWAAWREQLIAWLLLDTTEMAAVDRLTKMAVIATIANVAAGGGLGHGGE